MWWVYSIGFECMLQREVHIALFEWQKHTFFKTPFVVVVV